MLANPNNSKSENQINHMQAVAQKMGLEFRVLMAADTSGLESALRSLPQGTGAGLLVNSDPFFTGERAKITALAARQRIPAIYPWREYVDEGGMMSYGSSNIQAYRVAGKYAGRLIKGAQVNDLPVWQANKLSLVLNLKGASAVGVTIPDRMIAMAEDVIE
jgi:putative ABC transport system substrate-binding protein